MSREKLNETLLKDPLRELTRNKRKYLLLSSVIAIAVIKAGFVPTKVSALGIEFQQSEQRYLIIFISLIALYFLASFILYAVADLLAWIHEIRVIQKLTIRHGIEKNEARKAPLRDKTDIKIALREKVIEEQQKDLDTEKLSKLVLSSTTPVVLLKGFLDFVLPILVGIYAIDWIAIFLFFT